MAAVTYVQRSGRVGRHELDHQGPSGAEVGATVGGSGADDRADLAVERRVLQEEIDETGAGHLHLGDRIVGRYRGHEGLRQSAWVLPRGLAQPQAEIAREIPVGRIAGALDLRIDVARRRAHQLHG